jgi:hypothetical protein
MKQNNEERKLNNESYLEGESKKYDLLRRGLLDADPSPSPQKTKKLIV